VQREGAGVVEVLGFLTPDQFLAFMAGALVVNLVPGADIVLATACGIQGGPKAGAAAGIGAGTGVLGHVALAVLGVSAMIAAHPAALDALRGAGAAYLVWLAVKAWRAGPAAPGRGHSRPANAWRKGVVTNLLNPKPVLFVMAFLPQFVVPGGPPVWQQILILGLVFASSGTLVTVAYGVTAGYAGQMLAARMGFLNRIAAVMFAGLALRLVMED